MTAVTEIEPIENYGDFDTAYARLNEAYDGAIAASVGDFGINPETGNPYGNAGEDVHALFLKRVEWFVDAVHPFAYISEGDGEGALGPNFLRMAAAGKGSAYSEADVRAAFEKAFAAAKERGDFSGEARDRYRADMVAVREAEERRIPHLVVYGEDGPEYVYMSREEYDDLMAGVLDFAGNSDAAVLSGMRDGVDVHADEPSGRPPVVAVVQDGTDE